MKKWIALLTIILSLIGNAVAKEYVSYKDAVKASTAEGKYTVLVFSAKWCNPCKMLHKNLAAPAVQEELKNFNIVEIDIDIDGNKDLCTTFKVGSIPHMAIVDGDRLVDSQVGVQTPRELVDWLKSNRKQ